MVGQGGSSEKKSIIFSTKKKCSELHKLSKQSELPKQTFALWFATDPPYAARITRLQCGPLSKQSSTHERERKQKNLCNIVPQQPGRAQTECNQFLSTVYNFCSGPESGVRHPPRRIKTRTHTIKKTPQSSSSATHHLTLFRCTAAAAKKSRSHV